MVRTELQTDAHRLANYLEGKLADIARGLFAESMVDEAQDIIYSACSLIKSLRDLSTEGGDE